MDSTRAAYMPHLQLLVFSPSSHVLPPYWFRVYELKGTIMVINRH